MGIKIFEDIESYLSFLNKMGYFVSFSKCEDRFEPYTAELLKYEIHTHSVCSYLKHNRTTIGRCIENKRKLEKSVIKEMLYSCCYAGVEEYVIPVWEKENFLINIHVSGFRSNLDKSKQNMKKVFEICDERFLELYDQLSERKPSAQEVLSFIKPLEYMIKDLYGYCRDNSKNTDNLSVTKALYLKVVRYIHENYMYDISCNAIADEMKYSPSYLRYVFKKEGDMSIGAKINDVRLRNAGDLLLNTKLNITEISSQCGFCDSNYYSTVFKKKFGVSPKKYRNKFEEQIS